MMPNSRPTYAVEVNGDEIAARIRAARLMRAQAAAEIMGAGFAAVGRLFRPLSRPVARWRDLAALRRTFAALDVRTLRDLGLSPQIAAEITPEALADHPLAVPGRWRAANENPNRYRARNAA